ncbi:class I SAM-dependent methyltransferase [Olivibacter jilunii]|uniref:class I SAM-dependent methyltransferase n=1 Tax=Olivibacter jilunii TaxID=985016 RepID=UPI003F5CE23B
MMKAFWDERYSGKDFVYGENPNEYLKAKLTELRKGKILLPAEGEGRNAVFAAKSGWMVSAFDQSTTGKKKAERLAQKNEVAIDYTISDLEDIRYPENSFDVLALVYAHFHSEKRTAYHQKLSTYLRKGGTLILEAFGKRHMENQKINPNAGGPRNVAMLYKLEELMSDFEGFEFLEAIETKTELNEGKHHLGKADVVRIFAIKK